MITDALHKCSTSWQDPALIAAVATTGVDNRYQDNERLFADFGSFAEGDGKK